LTLPLFLFVWPNAREQQGGIVRHSYSGGWIEVVCGSMFSGKTEELIRRVRRARIAKQQVQVFKPMVDKRYGVEKVSSHNGVQWQAVPVGQARDILERLEPETTVVAVDEAQFFDWEISQVCTALADRGLRVILAGLDMDFRGEPFGPMPLLMAEAEEVTKLQARRPRDPGRRQRIVRSPLSRLPPGARQAALVPSGTNPLGAGVRVDAGPHFCYNGSGRLRPNS